jgi:uncharacterized membrane protein SirB2
MYFALKHAHLTFVLVSITLFYFRFYKVQIKGDSLPKALKIIPHINDTLLLATAVGLCITIQQYPIMANWLTIKLAFVIGYIVFAFKAIKATEKPQANLMLSGASICLVLTIFMAINKI